MLPSTKIAWCRALLFALVPALVAVGIFEGFYFVMIVVASIMLVAGTTFFVSTSKFAKEVGVAVNRYFQKRQRRKVQKALADLQYHAQQVINRNDVRGRLLLKRREKRDEIEEKIYLDSLSAVQNQIYAGRIRCMERWNFLKKHHALPTDPLTGNTWNDFDYFLDRIGDAEKICA